MAVAVLIDVAMSDSSWWATVIALSRAILLDRATRRKWLGSASLLMLALFATGLWLIPGWLAVSPQRFGFWWIGVAVWTLVVLLFSLCDALLAIREERDKMK